MSPAGSEESAPAVLLDTNVVIALFAGDAQVVAALDAVSNVFIPAIVLGELLYGAQKSARPGENAEQVRALAEAVVVLPVDAETAPRYGEIKAVLRNQGTPIPENDLWIAALARQHDLALATRDAHFDVVSGFRIERW